jgi:hypothetical protein
MKKANPSATVAQVILAEGIGVSLDDCLGLLSTPGVGNFLLRFPEA